MRVYIVEDYFTIVSEIVGVFASEILAQEFIEGNGDLTYAICTPYDVREEA